MGIITMGRGCLRRKDILRAAIGFWSLFTVMLLVLPSWSQAIRGVTDKEILLGTSCALSGAVEALGVELFRGSQAYFEHINRQGGVWGRKIRVKIYHDGYEPHFAVQNTIRLIKEDGVFMLFGYVGTPTLTKVLPLLRVFETEKIYNFAPFTGALPQRIPPYDKFVINIRASYRQETRSLVENFLKGGYRKIGFLGQADAYGKSGEDGVKRTLAKYGLSLTACATYRRNIKFSSDLRPQVEILRASGAKAVICMGTYEPDAAFIRDARDAGWNVPIANVSFAATDAMLDLLKQYGLKTGRDYTQNLISSQVVPSYDDLSLPVVREYRRLMAFLTSKVPEGMRKREYRPRLYSFTGLEGFINAKVLVELLLRAGPELDANRFMTAVSSMYLYDVGMGMPIRFSHGRGQGLNVVYHMIVKNRLWVPLTVWTSLRGQDRGRDRYSLR